MMPLRLNSIGGSKTLERNAVEIWGEMVLPGAQPRVGIGRCLVAQRDPRKRLGKGDLVAGNRIPRLRQNDRPLVDHQRAAQRGFVEGNRPRYGRQVMLRSRMPLPKSTVVMLA